MRSNYILIKYKLLLKIYIYISSLFYINYTYSGDLSPVSTKNYYIDVSLLNGEFFKQELKNNDVYYLFSHGRSGELLINGNWLNEKEIVAFLKLEIKNLKSQFKRINIYGCEFAKGEKGKLAILYIEKETGLQVSASTNITGKDGDWFLEVGNKNHNQFSVYQYNLQFCPNENGTVTNPFKDLGKARNITSPGIYYFDLAGTTFSTHVDANGYVQVAIDFGNGSGNLPQSTSLTNTTRGILTPSVLASLITTNEIRVSYSGGSLDATSTDFSLINRLLNDSTLHTGVNDTAANSSWTGTGASALTSTNSTGTSGFGFLLEENVFHTRGDGAGIHWIPSNSNQRITFSSGEISVSESLHLWVRANSIIDSDCDGINDDIDLDDDNDGILDTEECDFIGGIATQSSNYAFSSCPNNSCSADLARDGNTSGSFLSGSITHTLAEENPWWMLDMNSIQNIQNIEIYNRTNCCSYRLDNFILEILDSSNNVLFTHLNGAASTLNSIENINISGNKIRIRLTGTDRILSLAEVKVCGLELDIDNDGIPSRLDLDSDADGCPDAIEGAGNFTAASLVTDVNMAGGSTNVQQNLGNSSNEDGTPNIEGTSISDSESQGLGVAHTHSSETECCIDAGNYDAIIDSDGDNIGDNCDLDDDNDGILDTEECDFIGGIATQSSNYTFSGCPSNSCSADLARDGNTSGSFSSGSITHTLAEENPWWMLDMNSIQNIQKIEVYNRTNCCSQRLDDFILEVLDSSNNVLFTHLNGVADALTSIEGINISGNKIRIRLEGTNKIISLAEVKVFVLECQDIDKDGIPNNLDIDSDGDGCSDSYEAGVPNTTNNGSRTDSISAGPYGINGLANSIENVDEDTASTTYTSSYSNALDSSTYNCIRLLPVELLSFDAEVVNEKTVNCFWVTATEINNDYFTVERSIDGKDWQFVSKVNGAGNSNFEIEYNAIDYEAFGGVSYYRLKQTDFDGQYSYSAIRVVENNLLKRSQGVKIHPNPTQKSFFVEGVNQNSIIKIYSLLGSDLTYRTTIEQENKSSFSIDLSRFANGIYVLKVNDEIFKIIKH